MAITLTNSARHLIIIQLNNGESIYLPPGRTSSPVDEVQINGNEKISKMLLANVLSATQPKSTDEAGVESDKADAGEGAENTASASAPARSRQRQR